MGSIKYILPSLILLLVLSGCVSEEAALDVSQSSSEVKFDLQFETRGIDDELFSESLEDYFVEGRSTLLISQRGNNLNLSFDDEILQDGEMVENHNLYKYTWYSNPAANWEEGYNFQPLGDKALDWDEIATQPFGSGFAFGALYYPVEYRVNNTVETDQRNYNDLLRSNPLGAWHITNQPKSRLRFRLNHLMAAIRVTLLIPDWNPADNSGFGEDAAQDAQLLSVMKDFNIDWQLASSEEPVVATSPNDGDRFDIHMYLESVSNEVETLNLSEMSPHLPDIEETVRRATFTVLFPSQQLDSYNPIMRFTMKTMGGSEKNYLLYPGDLEKQNLSLLGGSITNFFLYLPRRSLNAIVIKAHIVDWTDADSEFTVIPEN